MRTRFEETQKMRALWVLAVVGAIVVMMWWGFIQQVILGKEFGDDPGPDWLIWVLWILFGLAMPWLLWWMHLRVTVDDREVVLNWRPLRRRRIARKDIVSAMAVTYRPIREYGGWGIRRGRAGWCYSVSGNRGVMLELRDGKRLLIGSQRAEELADVLNAA